MDGMTDNLYVMEGWVRTRIGDLHAAAARERLLADRPARTSPAARALSAVLGLIRMRGPLASAPHPR
jgi:hypothetical protein